MDALGRFHVARHTVSIVWRYVLWLWHSPIALLIAASLTAAVLYMVRVERKLEEAEEQIGDNPAEFHQPKRPSPENEP